MDKLPAFPYPYPEGFEPLSPDPPRFAGVVPQSEGAAVLLDVGPNHGNALVVVMTGRTTLPEISWMTKRDGDDVYLLGLNTNRRWYAGLNGKLRVLDIDNRGYYWTFAKGPGQAWLDLVSHPL